MNPKKLVKKLIPHGLFEVIEPWGHLVESFGYNVAYGFPGRGMKVIGVTGTNGKTSTAYLVHRMLQNSGYKTALMTTVAWGVGENIESQVQHYTNVPVPELMKRLKKIRAAKVDYVVLEITSQALAQNRAWGVPFSLAVMTNLTHEHLDYHKTFERYRNAKVKLFKLAAKNRGGLRTGIVNADDPSADYFARPVPNVITYGVDHGDLRAIDVALSATGSDFAASYRGRTIRLHTNLPGSFNVSNALAATGVGIALGLTDDQITNGIAALQGVEGRMTAIDEGQDFSVIVDFAHTPDSFEKLFKDIKPVVQGKLIVMFGSAGRRDEAKRAVQGKLAGEYADEVIITEEDDRDIDGIKIMDDIAVGAEDAGKVRNKDLFLVHDRTEAIKLTLARAKKGDTVLLLGKGHEKTIERANGESPWDEIATVREALMSP